MARAASTGPKKTRSPAAPKPVYVLTKGSKDDIVAITRSPEEAMETMTSYEGEGRVSVVKAMVGGARSKAKPETVGQAQ